MPDPERDAIAAAAATFTKGERIIRIRGRQQGRLGTIHRSGFTPGGMVSVVWDGSPKGSPVVVDHEEIRSLDGGDTKLRDAIAEIQKSIYAATEIIETLASERRLRDGGSRVRQEVTQAAIAAFLARWIPKEPQT